MNHDRETQIILLENALKERNELIKNLQEKLQQADKDYNRLAAEMDSYKKRLEAYKEFFEKDWPE